ncbi:hypothetical protein AVEN_274251-1 [Araneus ventricosus]|uniref:Uncharacterized protein n=1 Tax=Araneus ventricosus TaxID=182803 RepID=A0A4Y2HUZ6_ARAVE|nr:hypothetical protein AVEN_274251-1 [Araneus ventricosus]
MGLFHFIRRKLVLKASYRGGNGRGLGELKYSILFRCEGRLQISSSEANGPGKQKGSTVYRIAPLSRRPSLTSCPNKHIDCRKRGDVIMQMSKWLIE